MRLTMDGRSWCPGPHTGEASEAPRALGSACRTFREGVLGHGGTRVPEQGPGRECSGEQVLHCLAQSKPNLLIPLGRWSLATTPWRMKEPSIHRIGPLTLGALRRSGCGLAQVC